jgi:hypothetical protein
MQAEAHTLAAEMVYELGWSGAIGYMLGRLRHARTWHEAGRAYVLLIAIVMA